MKCNTWVTKRKRKRDGLIYKREVLQGGQARFDYDIEGASKELDKELFLCDSMIHVETGVSGGCCCYDSAELELTLKCVNCGSTYSVSYDFNIWQDPFVEAVFQIVVNAMPRRKGTYLTDRDEITEYISKVINDARNN